MMKVLFSLFSIQEVFLGSTFALSFISYSKKIFIVIFLKSYKESYKKQFHFEIQLKIFSFFWPFCKLVFHQSFHRHNKLFQEELADWHNLDDNRLFLHSNSFCYMTPSSISMCYIYLIFIFIMIYCFKSLYFCWHTCTTKSSIFILIIMQPKEFFVPFWTKRSTRFSGKSF